MDVSRQKILQGKLKKAEIRDVYRRLAPKYDLWADLAESRARTRALELAEIQNGESVSGLCLRGRQPLKIAARASTT